MGLLRRIVDKVLRRDRINILPEEEGIDPELLMHWRPRNLLNASCGTVLERGVKWTIEGAWATCTVCHGNWQGQDIGRFLKMR